VISPVARPLSTQDNADANCSGETSVLRVGFEPTVSLSERMKTFCASVRSATEFGSIYLVTIFQLSNSMACVARKAMVLKDEQALKKTMKYATITGL
jgi:hypothetical protein